MNDDGGFVSVGGADDTITLTCRELQNLIDNAAANAVSKVCVSMDTSSSNAPSAKKSMSGVPRPKGNPVHGRPVGADVPMAASLGKMPVPSDPDPLQYVQMDEYIEGCKWLMPPIPVAPKKTEGPVFATAIEVVVPKSVTTLRQWGDAMVTFGDTHKGRTYYDLFSTTPGYVKYALSRRADASKGFKDFGNYCALMTYPLSR